MAADIERAFLLERDAVNGKEGVAAITVKNADGVTENHTLFGLKKIQIDSEMQEDDFTVVGCRVNQKKTKGVVFTGSATIYYGTPYFSQMVRDYMKTGKVQYFEVQVFNDDPSVSIGRQTVRLQNCKLAKVPIAILDSDVSSLVMDIGFSFTSFEFVGADGQFKDPEYKGVNGVPTGI